MTILINLTRFFLMVALVAISSSSSASDEGRRWDEDKKKFIEVINSKDLSSNESCLQVWDILWTWSKKGNLEARADLASLLFPVGSHAPSIVVPGHEGDQVSTIRDATIVAIHGVGVAYSDERENANYYGLVRLLSDAMRVEIKGKKFIQCLNQGVLNKCSDYAVESRVVPSFEKFSEEIDALQDQGYRPTCYFH